MVVEVVIVVWCGGGGEAPLWCCVGGGDGTLVLSLSVAVMCVCVCVCVYIIRRTPVTIFFLLVYFDVF